MFGLRARHSIYTVIVFYIVANPATFKFVRKTLDIKNDDILLVVHAFVMGVLLYFGSLFIFNPIWRRLEGFDTNEKEEIMEEMDNLLTGMISKKKIMKDNNQKEMENKEENKEENKSENKSEKVPPTVKKDKK